MTLQPTQITAAAFAGSRDDRGENLLGGFAQVAAEGMMLQHLKPIICLILAQPEEQ